MNQKWIKYIQDGLTMIMHHLLCIGIAITILDLFQLKSPQIILWGIFGMLPFFFYYVRIHTKNIVLFYTTHLLVFFGVCLFSAQQIVKIIMIGITLYYCFSSIHMKMFSKTGMQKLLPAPFFIVLMGMFSMIEKIKSENDWEVYYLALVFVYIVCYLLFYFLKQYTQFIELNETSAGNLPKRELFFQGMKQTLLYSMGSMVIFLISANLDLLTKIATAFWNRILHILRKWFEKIKLPVPQEETTQAIQEVKPQMGEGFTERWLPDIVLDILVMIITVMLYVVLIAVVIIMLVLIYKFIKQHFMFYHKKKQEEILQNNEDIREPCIIEKPKKKRKLHFSFFNNREKVRKLFYKKVWKAKTTLIGTQEAKKLNYFTAKECCDKLSEQDLKIIYEKARYSNEEITAENMKQLFSKKDYS